MNLNYRIFHFFYSPSSYPLPTRFVEEGEWRAFIQKLAKEEGITERAMRERIKKAPVSEFIFKFGNPHHPSGRRVCLLPPDWGDVFKRYHLSPDRFFKCLPEIEEIYDEYRNSCIVFRYKPIFKKNLILRTVYHPLLREFSEKTRYSFKQLPQLLSLFYTLSVYFLL